LNTKTVTQNKGEKPSPPRKRGIRLFIIIAAIVGVTIVGLGVIFILNVTGGNSASGSSTASPLAGQYAFKVGQPGVGEIAPAITLPSTDGTTFDLGAHHGKTVLLYFKAWPSPPCLKQEKITSRESYAYTSSFVARNTETPGARSFHGKAPTSTGQDPTSSSHCLVPDPGDALCEL
jgi:hypothetical protein